MRMAAGLALLLAACSPSASGAPAREADSRIDCAIGSAATFTHECTVERTVEVGTPVLVIHHPDGGFRRFAVLDGGQGLAAADGAEALAIARSTDRVDVSVDGDRYRFPTTMLSDAGR
jgi:hypothetical protein